MFPNPQGALPLPARPSLAQYKKLAKDLVRICKSGDPATLAAWAKQWVESLVKLSALTITPGMPVRIDRWSAEVAAFARRTLFENRGKPCVLADAQFILARCHGFINWPEFAHHLDELRNGNSTTSTFEAAADAIVQGDVSGLLTHLLADPALVRVRSSREHHATLLHYAAANGVEGYRQRTPPNIVEIAEALLDNYAEIDATAEMYGGNCTTLGLAATSIHLQQAGVQIPLLQLLLDRGAHTDLDNSAGNGQSLIKACLANGRCQAAQFLATVATQLDLEEAIAVGNLEAVQRSIPQDADLSAIENQTQLRTGFLHACMCGRNRVIEFLIARGFDLAAQDKDGQTALHFAVIGAQFETVKLLLKNDAPLEIKNVYGGTPLGQALWSAYNAESPAPYLPILEELLAVGAAVEPGTESEIARLFRRKSTT